MLCSAVRSGSQLIKSKVLSRSFFGAHLRQPRLQYGGALVCALSSPFLPFPARPSIEARSYSIRTGAHRRDRTLEMCPSTYI